MGLTGKFTIPDSDLEVKNAYLSLYDSTLTVQVLPESSLMRKIYEERAEAPPNFYEAGGQDGVRLRDQDQCERSLREPRDPLFRGAR